MKEMDNPQKVTAFLKVTAEFYDPDATPETVRACVEQDLEDAGYEVDVDCVFPDEETFCRYMARNYFPPNADRGKVIGMNGKLALDYLEKCWKEHFVKDNNVPCKSDVPTHCIPLETREDILQELVWYREGKIPTMQPEYVDALIAALKEDVPDTNAGKWISVKDRLPPERDTIFAKFYGTKQWNPNMFQKSSDDVRVVVRFEDGTRMVSHDHTFDGKWRLEAEKMAYPKRTVTHWMENPNLPEDD